jgi:hypothetical protein
LCAVRLENQTNLFCCLNAQLGGIRGVEWRLSSNLLVLLPVRNKWAMQEDDDIVQRLPCEHRVI